jgi:hypothetical protein
MVSQNSRHSTHHSHICGVCQVPNQRRERNDVCKGDSRSPTRPSEVLVSIYEHVCAPLVFVLLIQSRGEVARTAVFDQRRVKRESYQFMSALSSPSGKAIELTVVVVARHDELCWRSPWMSDGRR